MMHGVTMKFTSFVVLRICIDIRQESFVPQTVSYNVETIKYNISPNKYWAKAIGLFSVRSVLNSLVVVTAAAKLMCCVLLPGGN